MHLNCFASIIRNLSPLLFLCSIMQCTFMGGYPFSFFCTTSYPRPDKRTYYEYTSLWHVYGILSMNSWFWSAVFHSRDVDFTEKLDYSSAVALFRLSLILSVLRAFNVRDETARVMVAAPLIAFVTAYILHLNFYKLDYGLNMKVCVVMGVAQLLT
ncbi:uncharacterized protein LOC115683113 [Syzygium oleosum]|uniref:uncharacterized protein LOC115683113 n=1 Tax=Syzygium oleosum TaxID=219896 RepID=UPI0024B9E418|nr:uncharacterized protein LOC115683113 [Syzygium oleosum]